MKRIYTLILIFCITVGFSQPPAGYYNSATGTGLTLKTQLYNIIKNHNDQGYNAIDNFFTSHDIDIYYEDDNTILDPYSEKPAGADAYNYQPDQANDICGNYNSEGDCYNPEHVIPQSVFSQSAPMRGDAHHLLPTDGRVNNFRSNYPFGVANTLVSQSGITNPTTNGSKLGSNLNSGYSAGYSGTVFEPIDEFKGDIARIYFYFTTRYQNIIANWNSYAMFTPNNSGTVIAQPFLNILLTWNIMDPVSQKEIDRNNDVYQYQGNRNPFVDNNNYVSMIWGAPLDMEDLDLESVSVYPNPAENHQVNISSGFHLTQLQLMNINGQIIRRIENPVSKSSVYTLDNLPQGFYLLKITSDNKSTVKKIIVN
ncbi:endonuclease [Flavobacterium pallidum]|uniref:Ribonuclease n=1 Tax=Flavobacterium pallidum TaxID=2172098 RepID=A0A2S1SLL4_9FLAO|nr:endonuclease [Flavobacterium pallidum]AWI27294.1 ribonuclease [Flavobacterium pallidum]